MWINTVEREWAEAQNRKRQILLGRADEIEKPDDSPVGSKEDKHTGSTAQGR